MKGRLPLKEAMIKMRSFCGSRERSHNEVRTKLIGMHVYGDDLEEIISQLIADGFLNEERFARSFARGKFRISRWGRNKIIFGLRNQRVADYSIEKGLQEIDEEEYLSVLHDLIRKHLKGATSFEAKQKTIAAMRQKGYETELILKVIKEIEK
jgi:regulatory protein